MAGSLRPKNRNEEIALFRAQHLGHLLNRELHRGELAEELETLSKLRVRPPGAERTRKFAVPTLRRWYGAYKREGLQGLMPSSRARGLAQMLDEEQRAMLLEIRREHPYAAVPVILRTLEDEGRLERGQVSEGTVRRLYRDEGLRRGRKRDVACDPDMRRRWEAETVGELWHGDVCHGASVKLNGVTTPVRVHAMLDDKSRFVVALRVLSHEREVAMLDLLLEAIRRWGAPGKLYLDNGSTYSGDALKVACGRLDVALLHAKPYDARARGKMERFWRTMREGCLDLVRSASSLHDVQVRLTTWLSQHYHARGHGGLMGRTPEAVWQERHLRATDEEALVEALTVRERRRVRGDGTLAIGGIDWEVREHFLVGKVVDVARTLADPQRTPWVEHDGQRSELAVVDPVANGKLRRRRSKRRRPGLDAVDFDPTTVTLDKAMGRLRKRGGQ